ncbi:MAG: general secretion pathway protein [Syntrophus sp. (in: bacteria)]|nr:general secretion pathway protein [Syntrophus sp. (in: bacteria)]
MDYLAFFNLSEDPFRLTPDPFFFYPSKEHNDVLSSLNYAIEQKEGFSLIVGEPGTGKTTILRIFMEKWNKHAEIALIMTPRLSPEEFLQALLEDLNINVDKGNKNEMIKTFRDTLIAHSLSDKRVIIIVDEAQNLPFETLEELRLLSNLETDKEKLLQIILIGQPELRKRLSTEELKQLSQRIAVQATLRPLNAVETYDYISFRLAKAGKGQTDFTDEAKKHIYRLSRGIPRLINLISSRSLMAAYIEGSLSIKRKHVEYAQQHLSGDNVKRSISPRLTIYGALGLTLFFVIVIIGIIKITEYKAQTRARLASNAAVAQNMPLKPPPPPPPDRHEVRKIITVTMDAHVRSGPSIRDEKVAWVSKGKVLVSLDELTDTGGIKWHKVKLPNHNDAWISDRVVMMQES